MVSIGFVGGREGFTPSVFAYGKDTSLKEGGKGSVVGIALGRLLLTVVEF